MARRHQNSTAAEKPAILASFNQLEPVSCEYVGTRLIKVTLKDEAGDLVNYTMTTGMFMANLNIAIAMINSGGVGRFLTDLQVI